MDQQKAPAGWYADRAKPWLERYWDGDTWTPTTRTGHAEANRQSWVIGALAFVVLLTLVAIAWGM